MARHAGGPLCLFGPAASVQEMRRGNVAIVFSLNRSWTDRNSTKAIALMQKPEGRVLRSRVLRSNMRCAYLQDSLTISTFVTFKVPCSLASASIVDLAFSLAPCAAAFETSPVTVTV